MGKHDKHDAVIANSSEEFLQNRIARLEKENKDLKNELVFKNDTILQLQKQCAKMSKWASEIEANAKDEVEKWKGKALSLVDDYV